MVRKKSVIISLILFVLVICVILFFGYHPQYSRKELGLLSFYGSENFYLEILENKNTDSNIEVPNSNSIKVDPLAGPYLGWKTEGKPAANPTKVAANGLYAILNRNVSVAQAHAQWLKEHSFTKEKALFFPFEFDFEPYYPFIVKAPWNSGLTQGLALGLFSYLYKETGQKEYLDTANQIYNSYLIPIEKGGFTRFENSDVFFEEYPTEIPTIVLNGAAVAILALHDYALLTNHKQALQMFNQSIISLEKIISQYETIEPKSGIVSSYYSLGKPRPEVLGRFFGNANLLIDKIKLVGIKKSQQTVISVVDVGSNQDGNVAEDFYIYLDLNYMNWGESQRKQNYDFRKINGTQGTYNHSPFKFVFNSQQNFDQYAIEVTYQAIGKPRDERISLQLFDEKEYWELGKLIDQAQNTQSNTWKTEKFIIPSEFIDSWSILKQTNPLIDYNYLDDNQILIEILGTLSNSQVLLNYADRWRDSELLVPARYFNNFPPEIFINKTNKPVLTTIDGGQESRFVEYPSVIKIDQQYFMFYSGYGEDEKWRIYLATSNDGNNFIRQGQVFNDQILSQYCQGNQAFPFVIKNNKIDKYLMYFSCASKPQKPYDKIVLASSLDGLSWKYEKTVIGEGGLDPFVVAEENQYRMFFSIEKNGIIRVEEWISDNGLIFKPRQVIVESSPPFRSFYSIGGFKIDNNLCLLLESITFGLQRNETLMYCNAKQDTFFYPVKNNPIRINKDWEANWDNIKYGFDILKDENKTFVYFNGIGKLDAESDGSIGKAELDIDKLRLSMRSIK